MKYPLSGLAASTAGLAAALAAAALLAGCGPSHDAPANAGQASAKAQQNGPAAVAVARGKIEVEGGLLDLSPAVAGVVQQLSVKEGQSVQRGQLLLRLADDTGQADLAVAESEAQLAKARQKARAARLPQLKQTLSRWQAAAREGAADAQNVDEAAQALRDAQAEIDVAAAEAQVAQRKLEQLRAQHKRQELRAPEAGTVVRLATHAGSQAVPGTPAVVLLPQRPLQVRAEINESFAAAVREGMRATVTLDADGAAQQQLPSARVLRISPVYGTARLQDDQQRGPVRVIECVLVFEQAPAAAVRVGQNVRVQFHE
ncbi:hlyD secretion family protein [Delftia acidovorans]|jgi:multidrug resistance efflux pump|uniref:HlyD family efflux transporter periplasmic adaptor subunit n=1 Tax=Delftia acidovorans TaxID=80866 RepID=A0AAJ2VDJ5_DELAC|nr:MULTISPECIES: HlyD family efflux transporter periplasmic adaptor subunit [Delftia]PIF35318.1 CusB/HlyD membrane fusion family barrel-sandwich protein [Burkholderiales bacterium 23]APE46773.1 secretion protein HlyD [Delftia sp. HK171]EZP52114.1 Secretion protein HlyD family protein [Delftia sp. RIT313]KFJ13640.1 hlyD secretion family protein [Delftia acidovorans]KZK30554.1 secretion protein HlyD [Delftia sp. GW456-R20]